MEREDIIEKFSEFLHDNYYSEMITAATEGRKSLSIDFGVLDKFDPDLADYVLDNPEEVFSILTDVVRQIDLPGEGKINIRFFNLPDSKNIRIRNIRSEHIGKLIVVEGQVKRASEVRPEVSEAVFQCPECGARISIIQTEIFMKIPIECECGCRKGFKLIEEKLYDARWIAIEELFEITEGERPSEIRIFLKEDLTSPRMQNKTEPGNRVKIIGVLKQMPKRLKGGRSRQMDIYIDTNNVQSVETEWEELDIQPEEEKKIVELAKDPEIYTKLVASIAPALFGMEDIKEAIVLQLFGGVMHIQKDKSRARGDIHILLVGDPSTAKSVMMKVVSGLIPRGRYVSGKGVTGAGLTATVVKDEEFLGGWVLEAGALVMSNRSLICIDEFEKIEKTDQVAMHEAMEQGTISIAKANIVATLPAQTAILGGGNPKFGRFDPFMPIKEQIDVPETLLTRFDLKFALRDIPNPEQDERVAEHILKARHFEEDTVMPAIDANLLKKYIAYARKKIHPKLTREAGNTLKDFFVKLRGRVVGEEAPVAITLRQYEALIRMAEASAKIRLHENVTMEDAMRSIRLMKVSLRDFGLDQETGQFDIDRAEGHVTATQRSRIRTVLDIISDLENVFGKNIPVEEVMKRASQQNISNVDDLIRKMIDEGVIFEPSIGMIKRI